MTDETAISIDDCLKKCKQEHARHTVAELLDKLATMLALSPQQAQEKFGRLRRAGLVTELCHLICVPGYGDPLDTGKESGVETPDATHDPKSAGG